MAMVLLLTAEGSAAAQPAPRGDVTVTGDNRVVCRPVTRTATRMRVGRICRTQSQWAQESGRRTLNPNDPNSSIDGAADTLDALAADDISTNCIGDPPNRNPDTPLGPR